MRSVSRVGKSDVGANARRINAYLARWTSAAERRQRLVASTVTAISGGAVEPAKEH